MKSWLIEWKQDKCSSKRSKKEAKDFIKNYTNSNRVKSKKNIDFSCNKKIPYSTQITMPQWRRFRLKVIAKRGGKCEFCGSAQNLQVHHNKYINDGRYAWQYPMRHLTVLCRNCHKHTHGLIDNNFSIDTLEGI